MPRILTAEDTRLSDIQKAEIETTTSILDLVKNVDENILENSNKQKLVAALLNRVSNDEDIIDALNLEQFIKPDEEDKESDEGSADDESGGEESEDDDFDFNM
jgi:hypothetical protein